MALEKEVNRRDVLQGVSAGVFIGLAGCNTLSGSEPGTSEQDQTETAETPTSTPSQSETPTPTPTPTPQPEFTNPDIDLGLPPRVEAWNEYQLDCSIDTAPDVEQVTVQIRGDHYLDETFEDELSCGETFSVPTWGKFDIDIQIQAVGEKNHQESRTLTAQPKKPESFEKAQFVNFLNRLGKENIDVEKLLSTLSGAGQYTQKGNRIFSVLGYLVENNQTTAAVGITDKLVRRSRTGETGIPAGDINLVEAIPESPEEYRDALAEGFSKSYEFEELRLFEVELYNFENVLEYGLKLDQNRFEIEDKLAVSLSEASNNLFEKGYFTENDIAYLQLFTEIARYQHVPSNPRWKEARRLIEDATKDGQIDENDFEQLEEVKRYDAADKYSKAIKETVLGIPEHQDAIIVETEYTTAVDEEDTRETFQKAIDEIYEETGLAVIAPQAENGNLDTFQSSEDWKSRTKNDIDGLADRGMHKLSFDDEALEEAAGKASYDDSNFAVAETESDEDYTIVIIKHELGHVFGIHHHWEQRTKYLDSIMSYDKGKEVFLGDDIEIMRNSNYGMQDMSMETIEDWAEDETTLTDEYNEVLTPEDIELDTA